MHDKMGPVWKPNPENCKNSFSTQYNTEQFWYSPLLPPDKHHSSNAVYWRRENYVDRVAATDAEQINDKIIHHG